MPHRIWKHQCTNNDYFIWLGLEQCETCGKFGEYDGWGYNMVEAMGAYQRRTGMKPLGPHRALTDEFLSPLMRSCEICNGMGLIPIEEEGTCCYCPACKGTKVLRTVSDEVFEVARQQVLKEYPEATVSGRMSSE
jgi:hypothetical protein